jgi:hypothetical protein
MWLARALRSVMTPLGVDTIATPRPFMTAESSSALVDTQAWLGNAVDALDHRTAGVILQANLQRRLAVVSRLTAKSST